MQDPNQDTEWNDLLRERGIIPPKKEIEIKEEDFRKMVEQAVEKQFDKDTQLNKMNLDQLKELEDDEDERILEKYSNVFYAFIKLSGLMVCKTSSRKLDKISRHIYSMVFRELFEDSNQYLLRRRQKRLREMMEFSKKAKFGELREITAVNYVDEVNKAGPGIHVVLHLYKDDNHLCKLVNAYLSKLARKYPCTKFLKSVSTSCVENYADELLPTVFVYVNGQMIQKFVGPSKWQNISETELEKMLLQFKIVAASEKANSESASSDEEHRTVDDYLMRTVRRTLY